MNQLLCRCAYAWVTLGVAAFATPAVASEPEGVPSTTETKAPPAYDKGEALPLGLRAERNEAAFVTADGGYDGARKAGIIDFAAEIHIWGPITVRVGGTYISDADDVKPTVGALVQLFNSDGLAGSFGVFYKPEGLTEPEGEIEATFALGKRFENATLVGSLTYGQDGEAEERDGEVRVGGFYKVRKNFYAGADARFRFSLGTSKAGEPDYDILGGPLATLVAFDTAFTAQVGVSAVKVADQTLSGPEVLFGISRLF